MSGRRINTIYDDSSVSDSSEESIQLVETVNEVPKVVTKTRSWVYEHSMADHTFIAGVNLKMEGNVV